MYRFPIEITEESSWNYYIAENDEISRALLPFSIATFRFLKKSFEEIFGTDYVNDRRIISVLHHEDGPECSRPGGLILLSHPIKSPLQFAYQFSHELCHHMVSDPVHTKFRWFEETLCELASLYFLKLMYTSEELPSELESYRKHIPNYFNSAVQVHFKFQELLDHSYKNCSNNSNITVT